MVPMRTTEYLTLTPGSGSYTVGEHGAASLNTIRPEKVEQAWVVSGDTDYYLSIIGANEYNLLDDSVQGTPENLYVKYSAPNAVFYVNPIPDAAYNLYFSHWKGLNEPVYFTESLLNTTELPRNYYNALKFSLAVDIAPYFEKQPSEMVVRRSMTAKSAILNLNLARNLEPVKLEIADPGRSGTILGY